MLFLSRLISLSKCLRFVPLPSSLQSIKINNQIENYFKEAASYFTFPSVDPIQYFSKYDAFMFLDKKKLAAFLVTSMDKCYSISNRKSMDFISFYFCTVTESYRGLGLSYKIMIETVKYLKDNYNLNDDTILTLHVSPKDKMMPVASKIYYSLGFKRGIFIKSSPLEMIYKIDTLFEKSRDMLEVADNEGLGYGEGYYFMIYCKLKDFNNKFENFKLIDQNSIDEKTKKLFEIMKRRLEEAKK